MVASSLSAMTPALLQSTSSREWLSLIVAIAARTLAKSCRSHSIAVKSPSGTSLRRRSSAAMERELARLSNSTFAPRRASSRAHT